MCGVVFKFLRHCMKKYMLAFLVLGLPFQPMQAARSHRPAALRIAAVSFAFALVMQGFSERGFYAPRPSTTALVGDVATAAALISCWVSFIALASCALPAKWFAHKDTQKR